LIKNIFLDRDGVVNEVVIREAKVESPRKFIEFKIRQEFKDFYEEIIESDFNLFIISNQPEIARNRMEIKDLDLMTAQLKSEFNFLEISYCLHDDSDNCNCRKPKPGMIINILERYDLLKNESIIIGDSIKDINAGKNAGLITVLLQTDYNKDIDIQADYRINKLTEIFNIMQE